MLTQEMMLEASQLLAANRRPCTRSPCPSDCSDCRALELAKELAAAAPKLKDSVWLVQKMDGCPGDHFEESRVCTECNMHARYHRSDTYRKRFAEGVLAALKGSV